MLQGRYFYVQRKHIARDLYFSVCENILKSGPQFDIDCINDKLS